MSFNDLKPIYKEFLLKLAVTLTKDELYQRSKSIMRRQKKKLMRRKKKNGTPQVIQNHIITRESIHKKPVSIEILTNQNTNSFLIKIYRSSIHEKTSFLVHMD